MIKRTKRRRVFIFEPFCASACLLRYEEHSLDVRSCTEILSPCTSTTLLILYSSLYTVNCYRTAYWATDRERVGVNEPRNPIGFNQYLRHTLLYLYYRVFSVSCISSTCLSKYATPHRALYSTHNITNTTAHLHQHLGTTDTCIMSIYREGTSRALLSVHGVQFHARPCAARLGKRGCFRGCAARRGGSS